MMDRVIVSEIKTLELFPKINSALIELLKGLTDTEWQQPTVLPGRTVKDLVSHILDGSLRRLSACRDNYMGDSPSIESYDDLVDYIQKLNRTWIEAAKRLSPQILISFLEMSEGWLYEYFKALDPNAQAKFSVAWAGDFESPNWFDIAREYTEKWHHQMQLRLAVEKPGIDSKELFYPAIETFMRGLSHVYKDIDADVGTGIKIIISGNGGGEWYSEKTKNQWELVKELISTPQTTIEMSDDTAWKLFTDSLDNNKAESQIQFIGNKKLGRQILKMKTVIR